MAITTIYTYPLNGTQRDFTIPFEYLARRFVVVTLIGTNRRELTLTADFRFLSKTLVQVNVAWGPADGYERIEIRRNTSATDRLVDFADGSILRASELNTSQVQTLHVAEEARNMVADTIAENADGDLDARGRRLVNLADALEPGHAVTLRQEQAWAQSALNSRNASEAAASLSVSARDAAQDARSVATAQAVLASSKAAESEESAVRSEAAAGTIGGNVLIAQQARSGAEAARDTAVAAAQSVQGVNIPSAIGNGLKWLRQKADELGFEYVEAYTKQFVDSLLLGISNEISSIQSSVSALVSGKADKKKRYVKREVLWTGSVGSVQAITLTRALVDGEMVTLQHTGVQESHPVIVRRGQAHILSFGQSGTSQFTVAANGTTLTPTALTAGYAVTGIVAYHIEE